MTADAVVGQRLVEAVLARAVSGGTVAHAYLFAGPGGLGKKAYARMLAAALNCTSGERPPFPPCGECRPCRQVTDGAHPDVSWISPDGANIKIEQTRALHRETSFSPHSGRFRVVVIDEAHRLTAEASNSILKLLEDTPRHTVFILVTPHPELLLGTILSRCQRLTFRSVPEDGVREHLARTLGLDGEEARLLARLARGNPGRAVEMKADDEFGERRRFLVSVLASIAGASDRSIAGWAQALSDAQNDGPHLDMLDGLVRDMAIVSLDLPGDLCLNTDLSDDLGRAADPASPRAILAVLDNIQGAREQLGHNVNRLLAWELLLLKIQWELGR